MAPATSGESSSHPPGDGYGSCGGPLVPRSVAALLPTAPRGRRRALLPVSDGNGVHPYLPAEATCPLPYGRPLPWQISSAPAGSFPNGFPNGWRSHRHSRLFISRWITGTEISDPTLTSEIVLWSHSYTRSSSIFFKKNCWNQVVLIGSELFHLSILNLTWHTCDREFVCVEIICLLKWD
jgi:hypothetical protein